VRIPRLWLILGAIYALAVVVGVLHFTHVNDVVTFIVAAAALGGLAWAIGVGTESVGAHFGPAVTGALQSTLGNLPELFIVLFALSAGEVVVAQTSIVGSLFANALFVLGLSIVAGSWKAEDGVMRFQARLPQDTTTLLMLAVFIIVLLGLSNQLGDRASEHAMEISVIGAVLLLSVYAFWLWGYLRGSGASEPAVENPPHAALALKPAIAVLAFAATGAALVSDWFVHALAPAIESIGISRAFTGLVIVAIAGNAVENVVGIQLAAKGQYDLAISVIKNSVAQIAVFLFPILVLLSLLFSENLTFVLNPVYIGALVIMALAMWQITGDGEAVAFEGWALVVLYLILAVVTFYE
jgi:Ca2+:H+ antiporter